MDLSKKYQVIGTATGAAFLLTIPAYAEAATTSSTIEATSLLIPACVCAASASALTAFLVSRSYKAKIAELSAQLEGLKLDLQEEVHLVGKHGVVSHPRCSLREIIAERESAQANVEVETTQPHVEVELETNGKVDDAEQAEKCAQVAQDVQDAFCKNPLETIEEKQKVDHKEDGLHTAVAIEDEEKDTTDEENELEITADIDYEKLAQAYVEKKTFKKRMLARSKGVQHVLFERLASHEDMMEGIPVIKRADGTVGDVGESWWDATCGASMASVTDADFGVDEPTIEQSVALYTALVDASVSASFQAQTSRDTTNDVERNQASARIRLVPERSDISSRVANPFAPEASESEMSQVKVQGDPWLQALQAMDEHFDDNLLSDMVQPVFADVVGDGDTLDEPDGLEDATNFLSFKAPAGHPEVTDTASYVNFLVENEFEAQSKGFGKHVKRYLKVS